MDKLDFTLKYLLFSKEEAADKAILEALGDESEKTTHVNNEADFFSALTEQQPNVVLLALPEQEMLGALIRIKGRNAGSSVVCLSRKFSTPAVVEAMRSGAFDCLTLKTTSRAGLKVLAQGIKRASKAANLWRLVHPYPTNAKASKKSGILGTSSVMQKLEGENQSGCQDGSNCACSW